MPIELTEGHAWEGDVLVNIVSAYMPMPTGSRAEFIRRRDELDAWVEEFTTSAIELNWAPQFQSYRPKAKYVNDYGRFWHVDFKTWSDAFAFYLRWL